MKLQLYLNREPLPETVKAGDVLTGVQICPVGDWPHGETVQHVTEDACRKMIDAATAEILVDFDHDAEEGGSTKAAAWLSNLRLDPERGLVGDFKFTDAGAEAVANRRFRFLSPCWECEEVVVDSGSGRKEDNLHSTTTTQNYNFTHVTPIRLVSVALTNKPNIPMEPVLNREDFKSKSKSKVEERNDLRSSTSTQNFDSTTNKKGTTMDPAKIKEALGLAPEATEEDILAALGKMKAENEEAAAQKAEAEKAAAEKEADEFAEANAKKCNREVVKQQYLANKEATIALVNAIPEPKEPAKEPVCNRAAAKTPSFANGEPSGDEKILATYENMAAGKAKDEFLMANAIAINRARNAKM